MKAESPNETKANDRTTGSRKNGFLVVGTLMTPVLVIGGAAGALWLIGAMGVFGAISGEKYFWPAALLSMVAAGTGSAALMVTWRYWPEYLPQGVLVAMGLRMFTTLAGILIFSLILGKLGLQFVLLIVGFYALGLISETVIALKIAAERQDS